MTLVWWRMALVVATLILLPRIWRGLRAMSWQLIAIYAGIGVLVTLHWLTFFAAIKLANASVAVTCIALGTVFLSLIEPWIAGRRIDRESGVSGKCVSVRVGLIFRRFIKNKNYHTLQTEHLNQKK